MNLPEATGSFEQPPAGTHNAICTGFIDLGTQLDEYQGEVNQRHKVMIRWELPDELMEDGRPFTISQFYTWSMGDKAKLRQHLEAWRNKPFEPADFGPGGFNTRNLLGKPCTLVVTLNDKGRARVTGVGPKMKGQADRQPENPIVYLALTAEGFDQSVFDGLSEKMKEMVRQSPEYRHVTGIGPVTTTIREDFNDEVPF